MRWLWKKLGAKAIMSTQETWCPYCGCRIIISEMVQETLIYGIGENAPEIEVQVPLRTCVACGQKFLDSEAEDIMQEAAQWDKTTKRQVNFSDLLPGDRFFDEHGREFLKVEEDLFLMKHYSWHERVNAIMMSGDHGDSFWDDSVVFVDDPD